MTDPTTRAEEGAKAPQPIPVRKRFYLTECEHCGWVGSSEQCFSDGDSIECPACYGSMAGAAPKSQGVALHGEKVMQRILAAESRAASAEAEVVRLAEENDLLRASLANGSGPCPYCELPKEDWAKCASGFPGCGRADDAMMCPNVGASLEAEASASALRDRVAVLESENAYLREHDALAFVKSVAGSTNIPEDIRTAASRLVAAAAEIRNGIPGGSNV